jgi:hypothetical protein
MSLLENEKFVLGLSALIVTPITMVFGQPLFVNNFNENSLSAPPELQPYFMVLTLIAAFVMGIAIGFILIGFKRLKNVNPSAQNKTFAMFFVIAWGMVNGWAHDNFHVLIGIEFLGLLMIELVFHVTTQIAGIIAALCMLSLMSNELALDKTKDFSKLKFGPVALPSKVWFAIIVVPCLIILGTPISDNIIANNAGDPGALLPFYIFLGIMDAFTFGFALWFILKFMNMISNVEPAAQNKFFVIMLAISWTLLSWWPHTRMHLNQLENPFGILMIDIFFHVPLQIAHVVAGFALLSLMKHELTTI